MVNSWVEEMLVHIPQPNATESGHLITLEEVNENTRKLNLWSLTQVGSGEILANVSLNTDRQEVMLETKGL